MLDVKITRYLVHTIGDQSLLAIAFVTEDAVSSSANIVILLVDLMRPKDALPIISFSDKISKEVSKSGTHESMCAAVLKEAGIPSHHQVIFTKIPEPMS
jgi:hypothetical protein